MNGFLMKSDMPAGICKVMAAVSGLHAKLGLLHSKEKEEISVCWLIKLLH